MLLQKVYTLLVSCFWINLFVAHAQDQKIADSLALIYQQPGLTDSAKLKLLGNLSFHEMTDLRKGLRYAEELIGLAEQMGNTNSLRAGYFLKGNKKRALGSLDESLEAYFKSAALAKEIKNLKGEGDAYGAVADVYSVANNHVNASHYYKKSITVLRQSNDSASLASALFNAGDDFRKTRNFDSALLYFKESQQIFENIDYLPGKGNCLGGIGMVYAYTGRNELAKKNLTQAISIMEETENFYPVCEYLLSLAEVYWKEGNQAAAVERTAKSLRLAAQYSLKEQIRDAHLKMSELQEHAGNAMEALRHYKSYINYRDSINNLDAERNMANLRYNHEMSQKQMQLDVVTKQRENERSLTVYLAIILGLAVIILAILYKSFRQKEKAYKSLDMQKEETDRQRVKAEKTLLELQVTQKQLIQSAKMASLGELTAGIAHEIQNPLNFVNNFAESSTELLAELEEITLNKLPAAGKVEAGETVQVLSDNLQKIRHHGKQASSIVKAMLQHSRTSSGKKEATDINALAEEYLRLSYHGIRAVEKEFAAGFQTAFDGSIGKINIVPQDIGRVLLNLYNNAFYAINEKKKNAGDAYEPLITVSTKKMGRNVELSVRDNGAGIPPYLLDKIFQPFFTTKPAGQGTGLGLSLSYEVIKAHGGNLMVKTKEGECTEFILQLPAGS